MADWNTKQYLKFKKQRTQPARDLAMRVSDICSPHKIVDIGCGPGNSTTVLKEIFTDAHIIGIDNSPNMIEKAKSEHPEIEFQLCDALQLTGKYDLIFSNACLQWIPEHSSLIPLLMSKLNDGGVLAVQIPMNGSEPLYKLVKEVANEPKWELDKVPAHTNETLTPNEYFNILTTYASSFDIWEVKYYHSLENHTALVDWIKGTRLRPYLDFLGEVRGAEFEAEIVSRTKAVYPCMDNGEVLLGFRRFFFVATK